MSPTSVATLVLVLLVLGFYWLPSILASARRHPDLVTVVVVNALLGWTVVGWLSALARAVRLAEPS
jgi:RsiW-degrading membrane proteinase PrsW (M82 family)